RRGEGDAAHLPPGAGRAPEGTPRPPRQALEVQPRRRRRARPLGRLHGGAHPRAARHLDRRRALDRDPRRPQVVRPDRGAAAAAGCARGDRPAVALGAVRRPGADPAPARDDGLRRAETRRAPRQAPARQAPRRQVVPCAPEDDDGVMASITFKNDPVTTVGELPAKGSALPAFELVGQDLAPVTSADLAGKRVVLNIFPSLDTGTCAMSVRKFNELAAGLENTVVVCVSEDLPFAQARFCGAEGIDNVVTGSAFRSSFGADYGVTMQDGPLAGLLSRAAAVAAADRAIVHTQQLSEVSEEPDYEAAAAALA